MDVFVAFLAVEVNNLALNSFHLFLIVLNPNAILNVNEFSFW